MHSNVHERFNKDVCLTAMSINSTCAMPEPSAS